MPGARKFLFEFRRPIECSICHELRPITAGHAGTGAVVCSVCVTDIIRDGHEVISRDPTLVEVFKAAAKRYFVGKMLADFMD